MKKIILVLAVLLIAGCCGFLYPSAPKDVLELVPKTANVIMILRPSAILNDSDITSYYNSYSPQEDMATQLSKIQQTAGLNLTQIDTIVLFFEVNSLQQTSESYGGFVARGVMDNNSILEKMKVDNYVTQTNYGDQVIYESSSKNAPENKTYFVFLDGSTLVGGSKQAVQDSIDTNNGKLDNVRARQNFNQTYNSIDKNSLFILLMDVSPLKSDIRQSAGNQPTEKALSHVDFMGLSILKASSNVNLTILLTAEDSASANDISDQLSNSLTSFEGMIQAGSAMDTIAREVNVNSNGNIVTVSLSSNFDELRSLADQIQSLTTPPPSSS